MATDMIHIESGTSVATDGVADRVGIGTDSPDVKLTVHDGDVHIKESGSSSDAYLKLSVDSESQIWLLRIDNSDGDKLLFVQTCFTYWYVRVSSAWRIPHTGLYALPVG